MSERTQVHNQQAVFWLHRLVSEKCQDLKKISEQISILNHQAQHYDKMRPQIKSEVVNDINKYFNEYNWNYIMEQIDEDLI